MIDWKGGTLWFGDNASLCRVMLALNSVYKSSCTQECSVPASISQTLELQSSEVMPDFKHSCNLTLITVFRSLSLYIIFYFIDSFKFCKFIHCILIKSIYHYLPPVLPSTPLYASTQLPRNGTPSFLFLLLVITCV